MTSTGGVEAMVKDTVDPPPMPESYREELRRSEEAHRHWAEQFVWERGWTTPGGHEVDPHAVELVLEAISAYEVRQSAPRNDLAQRFRERP